MYCMHVHTYVASTDPEVLMEQEINCGVTCRQEAGGLNLQADKTLRALTLSRQQRVEEATTLINS